MLEEGSAFPHWIIDRVDEGAIRSFAAVLDDPNPIHLDLAAVRTMGLGDRVINQGPAGIGYLMSMLQASVPGSRIEELSVNLSALIYGGDRVVAGGSVETVGVADGLVHYGCSVWLETTSGSRAIEGTATIVVPESQS